MTEFLTQLTELFKFLVAQLTSFASFFTDSTLGIVILGVSLFGVIFSILIWALSHLKK